jgi:hypothetical protein
LPQGQRHQAAWSTIGLDLEVAMQLNPKANPDCAECRGTGIVVCDHGGDGRFVVEQKCECVTQLPWYAMNDPGAEPDI